MGIVPVIRQPGKSLIGKTEKEPSKNPKHELLTNLLTMEIHPLSLELYHLIVQRQKSYDNQLSTTSYENLTFLSPFQHYHNQSQEYDTHI